MVVVRRPFFLGGEMMSTWTAERIDSLAGRTFVVTGGCSGIGLETVKRLLEHKAYVIGGAPDEEKGRAVMNDLKREFPEGTALFYSLDLGSQSSIFGFVEKILRDHPRVDVLINNAGIAAVPGRMESVDGHELTFSGNYLGHFILTSQLFPLLLRGKDPRVVTVSGLQHRHGKINLEDLDYHMGHKADVVYAQAKLALLMFALELHRRCLANEIHLRSIPVHPGAVDEGEEGEEATLLKRFFIRNFGQRPEKGALPLLFGATSLEARSGIYYGPDGPGEIRGNPTEAKVAVMAENMVLAQRLWKESERITGVRFNLEDLKFIGLH